MIVRVVVVDDHELLRAGLVTVLGSGPDIEVVAEAADGPSAVRLAMDHRPDIVLMDVEMPGGDGISATRQIRAALPDTRVLILTMFDLDEYVVQGLRAGASGFLLKTTEPRGLVQAVLACAAGQTTVGPTVLTRLLDGVAVRPPNREACPTPRSGTRCSSPSPPSNHMSPRSSPSSACETGCRPWSSPTATASTDQATRLLLETERSFLPEETPERLETDAADLRVEERGRTPSTRRSSR
jgi:DNA-binding NarL/FixJ family response regulator